MRVTTPRWMEAMSRGDATFGDAEPYWHENNQSMINGNLGNKNELKEKVTPRGRTTSATDGDWRRLTETDGGIDTEKWTLREKGNCNWNRQTQRQIEKGGDTPWKKKGEHPEYELDHRWSAVEKNNEKNGNIEWSMRDGRCATSSVPNNVGMIPALTRLVLTAERICVTPWSLGISVLSSGWICVCPLCVWGWSVRRQ